MPWFHRKPTVEQVLWLDVASQGHNELNGHPPPKKKKKKKKKRLLSSILSTFNIFINAFYSIKSGKCTRNLFHPGWLFLPGEPFFNTD